MLNARMAGPIVAKSRHSAASPPILLLLDRMHLPQRENLDTSWQTHARPRRFTCAGRLPKLGQLGHCSCPLLSLIFSVRNHSWNESINVFSNSQTTLGYPEITMRRQLTGLVLSVLNWCNP